MLSTPISKTIALQQQQIAIYALNVSAAHGMLLADNLQVTNLVMHFRLWQYKQKE